MGWASNRIQHHSGSVYSCCSECYYFSNVACVASNTTNFSNISCGVCIAAVMSASKSCLDSGTSYCGHLGDIYSNVSCIERCPHFRGKFLLMGHSKVSLFQSVL